VLSNGEEVVMADRTAATHFSDLFTKLASDPTDQHKQWAQEFYQQTWKYDFAPYQMYCDEALLVLGLARQDGDTVLYAGRDYDL
jgi:hypothetical protein